MPVYVIDTIRPKNSADFAIVEDIDVKGGFQCVATTAARDAITANHRKAGMLVAVGTTVYQLQTDLTTWTVFNSGGGGSGGAPSGPAGGDLTGTYPNPLVQRLTGLAGVLDVAAQDTTYSNTPKGSSKLSYRSSSTGASGVAPLTASGNVITLTNATPFPATMTTVAIRSASPYNGTYTVASGAGTTTITMNATVPDGAILGAAWSDVTPISLATFPFPSDGTMVVDAEVVAVMADNTYTHWWKYTRGFLNQSGSVSFGTLKLVDEEALGVLPPAALNVEITYASGQVEVNVDSGGGAATWYVIAQAITLGP